MRLLQWPFLLWFAKSLLLVLVKVERQQSYHDVLIVQQPLLPLVPYALS